MYQCVKAALPPLHSHIHQRQCQHTPAVFIVMHCRLTGTPLQNNLQELHALLSFAAGDVLGSAAQFRRVYGAHVGDD